jgi:hypothetical protein
MSFLNPADETPALPEIPPFKIIRQNLTGQW